MKINQLIQLTSLIALGLLSQCCMGSTKAADSQRPNVVIIFTDDQGYADVGCFGAEDFKTPNLDQMAREGMRFTDFYVAGSVCSPSRAALLTGCYPQRVGIHDVNGPKLVGDPGWTQPMENVGLSDQEELISRLLKDAGYATGCFGK